MMIISDAHRPMRVALSILTTWGNHMLRDSSTPGTSRRVRRVRKDFFLKKQTRWGSGERELNLVCPDFINQAGQDVW